MPRTRSQRQADAFDAHLEALVLEAEARITESGEHRAIWRDVAARLRAARKRVRGLLHPEDRGGAEG